ncbi:hypothetical protein ON010_g18347 [Phytophthora cinnamomi]|nr:hypothetical protein ON010_g18347 [Phytophthora cinnamomi]
MLVFDVYGLRDWSVGRHGGQHGRRGLRGPAEQDSSTRDCAGHHWCVNCLGPRPQVYGSLLERGLYGAGHQARHVHGGPSADRRSNRARVAMLSFVEFAFNNAVHASTDYKPFYVNGLAHPLAPLTPPHCVSGLGEGEMTDLAYRLAEVRPATVRKQVDTFLSTRLSVLRHVRDAMAESQHKQKQRADARGSGNVESYEVGDLVLLNAKNLPTHAVSDGGAAGIAVDEIEDTVTGVKVDEVEATGKKLADAPGSEGTESSPPYHEQPAQDHGSGSIPRGTSTIM